MSTQQLIGATDPSRTMAGGYGAPFLTVVADADSFRNMFVLRRERCYNAAMHVRQVHIIIAAALFLLTFALLFSFRAYDDNRLFSWQWMFAHADAAVIYLLLIAALIGAFTLSHLFLPAAADVPVIGGLAILAVLPFWTEPEIIVDASRYFTQAKHLSQYGVGFFLREWGRGIFAWTDLPLVPFCYGILFKLFGESRLVIQAFTTLLFSLTAILTYRIGLQLWGRETGLYGGILLLGMPYLLTQVPLMLVDVPTMFLLLLSLWMFLAAVERGDTLWSASAAAAIVLFALSKYSSWPMLSLHVIALLAYGFSRDGGNHVLRFKRGALILFTGGVIVAVLISMKIDVLLAQARLLREYQGPGLGRWGEGTLSTFLFQIHPFITFTALLGIVFAVRKRDRLFLAAAWLPLLVLLFNIQRIRYILPAFPFVALMAACGMQAIKEEQVRRFIVVGIVATSLTVAFSVYLPFAWTMSTANIQRAGAVLNGMEVREIEVIVVQPKDAVMGPVVSVALLDLYTRKELRFTTLETELRLPVPEKELSSLRFSWEFPVPRYYASPAAGPGIPIVVVSGRADEPLPAGVRERMKGYRLTASLNDGENIFQYAPAVAVYERMAERER